MEVNYYNIYVYFCVSFFVVWWYYYKEINDVDLEY